MYTDYLINTDDLKDILQAIEDALNDRFPNEFLFEYSGMDDRIRLYEGDRLLMETSTFTIYEERHFKLSPILD